MKSEFTRTRRRRRLEADRAIQNRQQINTLLRSWPPNQGKHVGACIFLAYAYMRFLWLLEVTKSFMCDTRRPHPTSAFTT
jgi:hypothetical protein